MSWDVSFYSAKLPPPPVAEMPSDWRGDDFGDPEDVRRKISESLPGTDWSDPAWGVYQGDTFSLELNLSNDTPCTGFMVHARGGGDAASPLVRLAERWGWYMLDVSAGEWVHHVDDPESGWIAFQEYRDGVLSSGRGRDS